MNIINELCHNWIHNQKSHGNWAHPNTFYPSKEFLEQKAKMVPVSGSDFDMYVNMGNKEIRDKYDFIDKSETSVDTISNIEDKKELSRMKEFNSRYKIESEYEKNQAAINEKNRKETPEEAELRRKKEFNDAYVIERQYNQNKAEIANKQKESDPLNQLSKGLQSTSDAVKKAQGYIPPKPTGKKRVTDIQDMTDQQLRDRINREKLEIEYSNYFGKPEIESKGRSFARETLQTVGASLAVASTAVGIIAAIRDLKSK